MQLGLFLKKYRKAVSLSGQRLSQQIGVSKHSLEKWENAGAMPNYSSALKLMQYFGLDNLEDIEEKDLIACISGVLQKPSIKSGLFPKPNQGAEEFFPFYFTNLLSEKDKRIKELEEMIKLLKEQNKELKKLNKRS